jgi:hypothetical protein
VVKQRIVQRQGYNARGTEPPHQNQGQDLPQSSHGPSRLWKEPMVGVVSMVACRIGKRQDAGDGSAGGAQDPAGHQGQENLGTGLGKHLKKLAKKLRPCRRYSVHIDLPVLIVKPIKTSDGRYALVDKPLKCLAEKVRKFTLAKVPYKQRNEAFRVFLSRHAK